MLKINDNKKFLQEIVDQYNLVYDSDGDYESGIYYAIYTKEGVVFDVFDCSEDGEKGTIYINGLDGTELDLLYDLIKIGLVTKEL